MRVAVTGSTGRLGSALMAALGDAPFSGPGGPLGWSRPEFDVDRAAEGAARLLERDRPEIVIHAAAWTDVDGCARDPQLAMWRNGHATRDLAKACADRRIDLVIVSTNEIFDGRRDDWRGYAPDDVPNPVNAYGASKLEGERRARQQFEQARVRDQYGRLPRLAIVRSAWLFGPGSPDFPTKILAAGVDARAAGRALRLVDDEFGSPTYTRDLADGIVELIAEDTLAPDDRAVGVHHLVNGGVASRAEWAREALRLADLPVDTEDVSADTWERASTPPRWAVLEATRLPSGHGLRPWTAAMADYAPLLRRTLARR